MDIVNLEMSSAHSALETDFAAAARDEARVDQAYAALAAQICAFWPTHLSASGDPMQIRGDFLHPFLLVSPKS